MRVSAVLIGTLVLGGVSAAKADTVWVEAEMVRDVGDGLITSPLLVKDDPLASLGSYITVAAGNNSKTSAPAQEGIVTLPFFVGNNGSYRIWGRVIAPDADSDSFWVRIVGKTGWIRWNDIPLGNAWHWALVVADGSSSPTSVSLAAGDYQLQVAYREDGARLDALVVTSDSSFNPGATPTAAPSPPQLVEALGTDLTAAVQWNVVAGAKSYIVERGDFDVEFVPVATTTGHRYAEARQIGAGCYRVRAVGLLGTSAPSGERCANTFDGRRSIDLFSITSPMRLNSDFSVSVAPGNNSKTAAPTHGRVRRDFQLAGPLMLKVWADVTAPDDGSDSFWVRIDEGKWINWNNIRSGCAVVSNSDAGGMPVIFNLPAGSHSLEFAYREDGTKLTGTTEITPNLNGGPPCSD
jgi:hypothetical protein